MVAVANRAPRARSAQLWDARTLRNRGFARRELPAVVADEFASFCARAPEAALDLDSFDLDRVALPQLRACAAHLRTELLHGSGLVWLRAPRGLDAASQRLFHLALGSALGEVLTHYGRLFEVRDRGGSYTEQAIPVSMTGASTSFHTDSSRRDCIPDFVGLLCERANSAGGDSLVSNALHAHAVLAREAPEALAVLHRTFIRDLVTPGVEKSHEELLRNTFPIFAPAARPEGLVFRYMRYWLERGQQKAGAPLDDTALAALDALDTVLSAPEHVVQFRLEDGDISWLNNRTLAHNRTAYEDRPGEVRCLQRMWVCARS